MKRILSLFFLCFCSLNSVHATPGIGDTLTIIGVGDIMLGTTFPEGFLPPFDGKYLLTPVAPILRNADVTFGNHEGTLYNGVGTVKKCKDSLRCFAFKSPEHYAYHLKEAGFDLLSIANNHSGDFGPEGRNRTMEVLTNAGIAVSGTIKQPYTFITRQGIKIALVSFSTNVGTPDMNSLSYARKLVAKLDSMSDVVIVSFHGGAEGNDKQHVPRKKEMFLEENRGDVYLFAHAMIDAGADVIFGHGPHVARAIDLYKNRFIIYSLGNFATYGRFSLKGPSAIAPIIKLYVDKEGRFIKGNIYSIKQKGAGGPVPDASNAALWRIKSLTAADIPEAPITISNSGVIRKKTIAKKRKR